MKTKKSKTANMENYKGTFCQMGFILALSLLFIAFEYSSADIADHEVASATETFVEVDYVPITRPPKAKLPPPPTLVLDKIIIDPFNEVPSEDISIIFEPEDFVPDIVDIPEDEEIDPDIIWVRPEKMPEFPGGVSAMMKYLSKNVVYPEAPQRMGVQGRVFVQFVVNKNGQIVDVKILKGVNRDLDAEALRVVQNMPKWQPGYQGGNAVNVSYNLPINFKLR